MVAQKQQKPSPEYIANKQAKYEAWSRKTKEANELIWEDFDKIIDNVMKEAYTNKHFEAYAHLDRLKHYIEITYPNKLALELELIRKIE